MLSALVIFKNDFLIIIELLFFIWYNKDYCTKRIIGMG